MNDFFNEDWLVRSDSYAEVMNTSVIPWLEKKRHIRTIPGLDGRPLYCVSFDAENALATVLIVHGFTENAYKYAELIWSLLHLRFSVIAYDQRGHGRSWRAEGVPDPSVTHVERFSDYVDDLRLVVGEYLSLMPKPFFLFAHSMGGAVASLFLENNPDVFSAAVLCAPMIAPNIGGIPASVAYTLASVAKALGRDKKNPFFMKRYHGPEEFDSSCATDPGRFDWYDKVKAKYRQFQNSVPSYRWSEESIRVTDRILTPGAVEKISCPVLLFTADADSSVLPGPQERFISRVPLGQHIFVPHSRHEIFRSTNSVLFPWWRQVISFYSENMKR